MAYFFLCLNSPQYTYGDYDWNTFETISLVPFEKNLIDHTMLNIEQVCVSSKYLKQS